MVAGVALLLAGVFLRLQDYPPVQLLFVYLPLLLALATVATIALVVALRFDDVVRDDQLQTLLIDCLFLAMLFATSLLLGYYFAGIGGDFFRRSPA